MELNTATSKQFSFQTFRAAATHKFKTYLKDKIHEAVYQGLSDAISSLIPADFTKLYEAVGASVAGAEFGRAVVFAMCEVPGLDDMVWRDAYLTVDGIPRSDGFVCDDQKTRQGNRYPHPDFILSGSPPTSLRHAYVVGEAKWQASKLLWYFSKPQSARQWRAMMSYAGKHTYSKTALFLTFARGDKRKYDMIASRMKRDGTAKGTHIIIISMKNKRF
jgi:hypothetical protein